MGTGKGTSEFSFEDIVIGHGRSGAVMGIRYVCLSAYS